MTDSRDADWDPHSQDVLLDPLAAYDAMRERCPVAYSEAFGWAVFRHRDVVRVLEDHRTFSNAVSRHLSVPNGMDPPEHTAYRRIIEPYFAPERMAAFEPTVRAIASDLLRGVAHGEGSVDLMSRFAQPFAARVQCAFLGWPDSLHAPLIRWMEKNHEATLARDRRAQSEIAREFEAYIDEMITVRTESGAGPDEDVTASLMHERVAGRPLSNEEIASVLRNWTAGEIGTIASAVGIVAHYLATHDELQAELRRDPALLGVAVDEILRIHGPLAANRRVTTRPARMGGRDVGAGERVTVMWVAANRDGRVFEHPEGCRLDRDPALNLLYGAGIHVCPGAPLARMELRVVFEELLAVFVSIRPAADEPAVPAVHPAMGYAVLPLSIR